MRYTIPSELRFARKVQSRILDQVRHKGFGPDGLFAIRLALQEALANAIRHGNGSDPKKKVRIQSTVTGKRAEIVVEDEGGGFDRGKLADPTTPENLCKCHGRGVYLIECYMDRVRWTHGGRRVRMVKENSKA